MSLQRCLCAGRVAGLGCASGAMDWSDGWGWTFRLAWLLFTWLFDQADDYLAPSELASSGSQVGSRSLRERDNAIDAYLEVTAIKKASDFAQFLLVRLDDEERRFGALILCSLSVGGDRDHAAGGRQNIPGGFQSCASHSIEDDIHIANVIFELPRVVIDHPFRAKLPQKLGIPR